MRHPTPAPPEPPPVTSSRRGLKLRHVDSGNRSFFEVANPGELERLRPELTQSEFGPGIHLRLLGASGTMLAEP